MRTARVRLALVARSSPQTDRLVAVVDLLASRPDQGMGLSEIARRLGLRPVTVHPMVAALARAGWVVRHPTRKTYRLGPALAVIGQAAASAYTALDVCHPVMVALQQELRLTVLAMATGDEQGTIVDLVCDPGDAPSGVRIGDIVPFQPPLGFSYMAWQDDKTVNRWLDRGGDDEPGRERYRRILDVTRTRGFSVDIVLPPEAHIRRLLSQLDDRVLPAGEPSHAEFRDAIERYASVLATETADRPTELDADGTYMLDTVSAPVFDGFGEVTMILALRGFRDAVTGAVANKIGQRLADAGAEITEAIGGVRP